jgi:hypothetical protein
MALVTFLLSDYIEHSMPYFVENFCLFPAKDTTGSGRTRQKMGCFRIEGICTQTRRRLQTSPLFYRYMLTFQRTPYRSDPFDTIDPFTLLGADPACYSCKANTAKGYPPFALMEGMYSRPKNDADWKKKRMDWAVDWVEGREQPVETSGDAWDLGHLKRRVIQVENIDNFVELKRVQKEMGDAPNMKVVWKNKEPYVTYSVQRHSGAVMRMTGYLDEKDRLTEKILDGVYDIDGMELKTDHWIGMKNDKGLNLMRSIQKHHLRLKVVLVYDTEILEKIQEKIGRPCRTIEYRSPNVMMGMPSPFSNSEWDALNFSEFILPEKKEIVLQDMVRWFHGEPYEDLLGDFMRGKKDLGNSKAGRAESIARDESMAIWWDNSINALSGEEDAEKRAMFEMARAGANHTKNVFILRDMGFYSDSQLDNGTDVAATEFLNATTRIQKIFDTPHNAKRQKRFRYLGEVLKKIVVVLVEFYPKLSEEEMARLLLETLQVEPFGSKCKGVLYWKQRKAEEEEFHAGAMLAVDEGYDDDNGGFASENKGDVSFCMVIDSSTVDGQRAPDGLSVKWYDDKGGEHQMYFYIGLDKHGKDYSGIFWGFGG